MESAGAAMDIRLIRRASVGLIVRAPRPVACGGMADTRFDDEVGVTARGAPGLDGVRTALVEEEREWSSAGPGAITGSRGSRNWGWKDLAFMFRTLAGTRLRSSRSNSWSCGRGCRRFAGSVRVSTLAFLDDILCRLAAAVVGRGPVPRDLRGALVPVRPVPSVWTRLCRRPRAAGPSVAAPPCVDSAEDPWLVKPFPRTELLLLRPRPVFSLVGLDQ